MYKLRRCVLGRGESSIKVILLSAANEDKLSMLSLFTRMEQVNKKKKRQTKKTKS